MGGEMPHLSLDIQDVRVGDELDVQMPADLDQFGRDDSHGTVIGGKCLVQLGHQPSNGRGFFKKIDVITGFREVEGGLHTRDASTHHHDGSGQIPWIRVGHLLFSSLHAV
jgi:hypothetical protein